MGKEHGESLGLAQEKEKVFKRMAISGVLASAGTVASCAHPFLVGPTVVLYADFLINLRKCEKLEEQTSTLQNLLK